MAALVFYPMGRTVWDSLHRVNPMQAGTPFVGLENYSRMLSDGQLATTWINTLIYVVLACTAETIFGVLAAALINQIKVGRQWVLAAVILPWALPGVVNSVIWLWIYQPGAGSAERYSVGARAPFENHVWFNDRTSAIIAVTVVHVWRMMPLTIVIVLAAMQGIPAHLYEAARIDGATRIQMFGWSLFRWFAARSPSP
jgi:multiple sugar transport system permease protein